MVIQQLGGQTGSDNFSAQNIKDYCIGSHLVNTISSLMHSHRAQLETSYEINGLRYLNLLIEIVEICEQRGEFILARRYLIYILKCKTPPLCLRQMLGRPTLKFCGVPPSASPSKFRGKGI